MSARARRQRGYSLLEVIVAFALLAVGIGIVIGILSGGVRQVRAAQAASEAALYGESLIATRMAAGLVEPGREQGEFGDGRYRWTLTVEDYADPLLAEADAGLDAPAPPPGRLRHVVLEVDWDEGGPAQRLRLSTLHAGIDADALPPPAAAARGLRP
ncbi:type II secretion system protein [Coralloluteibacterium stylophorae]|uniref:Prepilin-type N-terminal cleavage/methylation domain-containing protein n=1 Tax=Coralloluteibacterium stylophorae TaxID=1776034 RepID=A0A8J7VU64_9GAMM|nr:prepilin-type N-terminal cleavage/methylation domain-containing protein [Coralloluteibacterium stylophorae]MBS7457778.1 prepilin-type N-terminal cleavage/methylation domain-containing protein [Coralloluteibacterium stylophorae]